MKSILVIHWKDWCWSWNFNTLATWCEELTHWKRPWCWESLKVGGEGDNRGWDCWMASQTQWTWVWVNSGNWWWTRRPDMLQSIGSQRDRHDWATELNWTESWNVRCPGICSIAVPIKSRRSEKIIPVGPHLLYGEWKPVSKCFPLLASMLTALRHNW